MTSSPGVSRWRAALAGGETRRQFVRYVLVGGWNTLFGYATYALLTALLMRRLRYGYMLAAVLSNLLSITVAYLGYKFFVFKTQGNYLMEWLRCLLVYGVGMLPGLVLLPVVVTALHWGLHLERSAPYVAGALLTGLTAIASFLGHRHFSFRGPSGRKSGEALGNLTENR